MEVDPETAQLLDDRFDQEETLDVSKCLDFYHQLCFDLIRAQAGGNYDADAISYWLRDPATTLEEFAEAMHAYDTVQNMVPMLKSCGYDTWDAQRKFINSLSDEVDDRLACIEEYEINQQNEQS